MRFPREHDRIVQASCLLHEINSNPELIPKLLELQRFLVRNILRAEKRTRRLKRARGRLKSLKSKGRLPKQKAMAIKSMIKKVELRISDLHQLIFLWKCFGDGVAAVYQSTHSLKHLYYDDNYCVKESAGFISGKIGFRLEYKALVYGIKMGVPVILSDLTNIIRHGDVCGLAGADPLIIEIKSSNKRDSRAKRQIGQIQEIEKFYANDGAEKFRGGLNTKRMPLIYPEKKYQNEVNNCISEAIKNGISSVSTEKGIAYIALSNDSFESNKALLDSEMNKYCTSSTCTVFLNPNSTWLPAYPFTLSMSVNNTVSFMQESVHLIALIDLAVLKGLFKARGLSATMIMDGVHAIQLCIDQSDLYKGAMRISEQLFLRVAAEFQSLELFAQEHSASFCRMIDDFNKEIIDNQNGFVEIPAEWSEVRDFFASDDPELN